MWDSGEGMSLLPLGGILAQYFDDLYELRLDNGSSLAGFPFLKGLSDAENNVQASLEGL
jgi:hypothetical protein